MSFLESVKLAWAAWVHTISGWRIWIVAALPVLTIELFFLTAVAFEALGDEDSELGWAAVSGIIGFYLLLPVVTGWHACGLAESPPDQMFVRLIWTRRDWRYFKKLLLALLGMFVTLVLFSAVRLLPFFSDDPGISAFLADALFMICGLWLAVAMTSGTWMSLGTVLLDRPSSASTIAPRTVATTICAVAAPAWLIGATLLAIESGWLARSIGSINGILVPLAAVAALAALHRRSRKAAA